MDQLTPAFIAIAALVGIALIWLTFYIQYAIIWRAVRRGIEEYQRTQPRE